MKSKTVWLAIFCLIIVSLGSRCKNSGEQEIKFGAILTMSGESGIWGKNTQMGAELALDEINAKGGILGKKVSIIYEDSKGVPNEAVNGVNKLINVDKVPVIIGDVISSNILAIAPICERNKVILLNFGVAADITNAGNYIFRNWNSSTSDARFTSSYALKNYKKFVVLYQNEPYGVSSKNAFVSALQTGNANIVYTGTFDKGQTDFKTLLNSFKGLSYDAVYIACYYQEALNILKQMKELNIQPNAVLGTSEWEESNLTDFIKNNFPNKVFYGYPMPPDPQIPIRKHFVEAYTKKYNKQPEILSDNGYDAILMLQYGIEKAGSFDSTKIADALYTLKDFQGASGLMSFDKNGDVDKPFGLRTITSSGLIWAKE